jgi:ubiquinone biosynthesis protein Coq4
VSRERRAGRLASLPPPVARPVQWRRLRQALAVLDAGDPALVLDAAYTVGDALGGMSDERHLRRLCASEAGRRLIESRVQLVDALADHESLLAMAPDSLGRAYLGFAQRHGLDARKLIASQHAMSRDYDRLDPVRQWLSDRLTVMHDLWHVLAGYDATPAGESALMGFSLPQRANDRALPIFVAMSVVSGKLRAVDMARAIHRGARTVYLAAQPFEGLLPLPLTRVRAQLRIPPPEASHRGRVTPELLIREPLPVS